MPPTHAIDETVALLAATMLVLGLVSRLVKRLSLTSILLAALVGIAVGPVGVGLLEVSPTTDRGILEEVTRFSMAMGVAALGLQVTRKDMRRVARPVGLLLGPGMIGMWLATSVGAWLLLDLPWSAALLLGAVLAPTDPVVASATVQGAMAERELPRPLRRTLQVEAGINDGLALPLVLLGIVLVDPAGGGIGGWAVDALVHVGVAIGIGAALGLVTAALTSFSVRHSEVEGANLVGVGLALALLSLTLTHLLGGTGVLAVYVATASFALSVRHHIREQVEHLQEVVTEFFVLPSFVLLGAMLPWDAWRELGWAGLGFAAWALLLRRPPVVLAALTLSGRPRRDVTFLAWFGPLGLAAVYYATWIEQHPVPGYEPIFAAAMLAVAASLVVHSVTGMPGVRLYRRAVPADARQDEQEARCDRS